MSYTTLPDPPRSYLASLYYFLFPDQKLLANLILLEKCFTRSAPHRFPSKDEFGRNIDLVLSLTDFTPETLSGAIDSITLSDPSSEIFRFLAYKEIVDEVALKIRTDTSLNDIYNHHKYIVLWNTCPVLVIINLNCTDSLSGGETSDLIIDIGKYSKEKY